MSYQFYLTSFGKKNLMSSAITIISLLLIKLKWVFRVSMQLCTKVSGADAPAVIKILRLSCFIMTV
jgi:hypothetical protein